MVMRAPLRWLKNDLSEPDAELLRWWLGFSLTGLFRAEWDVPGALRRPSRVAGVEGAESDKRRNDALRDLRVTSAHCSRSASRASPRAIASEKGASLSSSSSVSGALGLSGGVMSCAFSRGRGNVRASHTVVTASRDFEPSEWSEIAEC
jgi:hypothetical protein